MKLSIVLSTQPAAFSALAYKGSIEDNIKKISLLGYDGVELAVRNPELLNLTELKKILSQNKLSVPAIGTGQLFGEEKLSFTDPQKQVRRTAIERFKLHVQLAASLNAVVIVGLVRGKRDSTITQTKTEQWLIEALNECASEAKTVKIVIEPINRYETDLINTVREGIEFLENAKNDRIGLLLDTFHMNIEEPSITESIVLAKERLFHFHIADSNRWFPGAGHINFMEIFELLDKVKYDGFISAEILPLPDADTAASKTIEYCKSIC